MKKLKCHCGSIEAEINVEEISPYETDTFGMAKFGDKQSEGGNDLDSEESVNDNEDYDYIDPEKIPDDIPEYVDPKILPKEVFLDLEDKEDQKEVSVEEVSKVQNIIYLKTFYLVWPKRSLCLTKV